MNLARVTSAGQITVPVEIRRLLNLKAGDKILFTQNDKGEVVIVNASINAIRKMQKAFEGVAAELGNPSEDDIQSWVDEVRYGEGDKHFLELDLERPKTIKAAEYLDHIEEGE